MFLAFVSALVCGAAFFLVRGVIHLLPIKNKAPAQEFALTACAILFVLMAAAPVVAFFFVGVWDEPPSMP